MLQNILIIILLPLLASCALFSTQEPAPVVDLDNQTPIVKGIHIVRAGESLYAIAWRYGRDYREIAIENHIPAPYRIYPGQKLSLRPPISGQNEATASAHLPKLTGKALKPKQNQSQLKSTLATPIAKNDWMWPANGKIIKRYTTKGIGSKGIDIAGVRGLPVYSAGPGKVVYSGSGLRGYGQLVIIKHNDVYLSAYAHNDVLLVKEGDPVIKGQVIAKMGRTDTDQVKLHFEIRKNGQPIDPLKMLPPKTELS